MSPRGKSIAYAFHIGGWRLCAGVVIDWVKDRWVEHRLGISARGLIPIEQSADQLSDDCHDYFPTTVYDFNEFMRRVPLREDEDVFVDYGCGLGRVLVLAAQYRFKKVIGVELSDTFSNRARRNIVAARNRVVCKNIEIWTGNAVSFPIPPEATVFYFYNPFHGSILEEVLKAIELSLQHNPRNITIIFNKPVHFEKLESQLHWLSRVEKLHFYHPCLILRNVAYEASTG